MALEGWRPPKHSRLGVLKTWTLKQTWTLNMLQARDRWPSPLEARAKRHERLRVTVQTMSRPRPRLDLVAALAQLLDHPLGEESVAQTQRKYDVPSSCRLSKPRRIIRAQ